MQAWPVANQPSGNPSWQWVRELKLTIFGKKNAQVWTGHSPIKTISLQWSLWLVTDRKTSVFRKVGSFKSPGNSMLAKFKIPRVLLHPITFYWLHTVCLFLILNPTFCWLNIGWMQYFCHHMADLSPAWPGQSCIDACQGALAPSLGFIAAMVKSGIIYDWVTNGI